MNYKRLKVEDCSYDESLNELISYRVTTKEKMQYEVVARENEISQSELLRNLARAYLHEYAISQDLRAFLQISNKIDSILLKKRVISSRKASILSRTREFLNDFEAFLEQKQQNISLTSLQSMKSDYDELVKSVFMADEDIYKQIEKQVIRISKKKVLKLLDC